jgi:hypothetical protein
MGPVRVPEQPERALFEKRVVASRLSNPRGVLKLDDGSLLVAEAGIGDPNNLSTGRIVRLTDLNGDADFDDDEERRTVLAGQPSVNILGRIAVNRDEVFGLADIEAAGGTVLVPVADPQKGSTIMRIDGERVEPWLSTPDNANSVAYDPKRDRWFAVQSFENTVIELSPSGKHRRVAMMPLLDRGQQPVPSALVYEPGTNALLVVLFSGQLGGDTGGSGVDFVKRSGKVVRVNPDSGAVEDVVVGLNAPTDLALSDRTLYVLEFCDDFQDPVRTRAEARLRVRHAGFERYSGRLLAIALDSGRVQVVAEQLDLPTHVRVLGDGKILVSEGQGTPGRMIPGPSGPTPLEGRLIELSPAR